MSVRQKSSYEGQHILVLGLGVSGRSAARYLLKRGAKVKAVDSKYSQLLGTPAIKELQQMGLEVGLDRDEPLDNYQSLVVSPGVPGTHPLYQEALKLDIEILGEIELGCRALKGNRVLGITGTNGKTTVTLLTAHVLNLCGQKARALGNVGVPLTQEVEDVTDDEVLVLELSSYQLETLYQKVLDDAVLLNITPDHLDRYPSLEAYAKAKCDMGRCLKEGGTFYVEENAFNTYSSLLKSYRVKTYGYSSASDLYTDLHSIFRDGLMECYLPSDYRGQRTHDSENMMAAYALCRRQGVSPSDFLSAWATFKKPAHRIQFVKEIRGVRYYDDSKGTNIDAVIRAVQAVPGPIILIAGGVDKGFPYLPWIEAFQNKVKGICAIGQAAQKIQRQLSAAIPVRIYPDLEQAVQAAALWANAEGSVLLSPGCSSLDMFKDYAHRGLEFQRVVQQL